MPLGPAKWVAHRAFYNRLTLADGDPYEVQAGAKYRLGTSLPSYVQFWKFHVCPATVRPHGITLRDGLTSAITSTIIQSSHAVMKDLVKAHQKLDRVKAGDLGPDEEAAEEVFIYAGNALQKAFDLAAAINPIKAQDFQGQVPLAAQLGLALNPFPDWLVSWADERTRAATYRHYLTHQGGLYKVQRAGKVLVPSRNMFKNRQAVTWTQHQQDYVHNPDDWVEISWACDDVIKETVAFLELFYERLANEFDQLFGDRNYQYLWGWRDGVDPLAAPRRQSALPNGCNLHGSTARRDEGELRIYPNDGPDPSGVRRF